MKYQNPVIRGFNPDPSVCRVGEEYYLVTSSFEYFPAIPVYHSRDLVNWTMIGHCIDRPEQLPLDRVKPSEGVWAPTIRHDGRRFYVTATFMDRGNFIVSSEFPDRGWSDPVWVEMNGIDPSVYFGNGEMYYCANDFGSGDTEGISLARLDPETGRILGEKRRIWQGTGGGWLEAPHIYHIGEYYYLLAAEGGSGWGHMVTEARSRCLWGPYEAFPGNPILTNRNDVTKQVLESGHADLIDDGCGNFFITHLAIRPSAREKSHLGRETFLTPVVKREDWFVVEGSRAALAEEAPGLAEQRKAAPFRADFSGKHWEAPWLFPGLEAWRLCTREPGALVLTPSRRSLADRKLGAAFAAVRQPDFRCTLRAELDGPARGVKFGVAVYLAPGFVYRVYSQDGALIGEKFAGDFHQVVCREPIPAGPVRLTLEAEKDTYRFTWSAGGETGTAMEASTRFLCTDMAGKCFTGTVAGVFAEGDPAAGTVRVTDFQMV
ncbi:MAG: family 43 glycosylhydrolase [Eubacteriales bacterium]|nr:family 43 glycosylhydrolase [Eubacteriales bacterium]